MYIAVKKSFFFSNVNVTATSRVATSTSNSQKVPRSIISAVAQTLLALAAPNYYVLINHVFRRSAILTIIIHFSLTSSLHTQTLHYSRSLIMRADIELVLVVI